MVFVIVVVKLTRNWSAYNNRLFFEFDKDIKFFYSQDGMYYLTI